MYRGGEANGQKSNKNRFLNKICGIFIKLSLFKQARLMKMLQQHVANHYF